MGDGDLVLHCTQKDCPGCKALTNECSFMRDLVFTGYIEGNGSPYPEEEEAYDTWKKVYQLEQDTKRPGADEPATETT